MILFKRVEELKGKRLEIVLGEYPGDYIMPTYIYIYYKYLIYSLYIYSMLYYLYYNIIYYIYIILYIYLTARQKKVFLFRCCLFLGQASFGTTYPIGWGEIPRFLDRSRHLRGGWFCNSHRHCGQECGGHD